MCLVEITATSWVKLFIEGVCSNLGVGAQGWGGEEEVRCKVCGRRHAYMRKFGVCRLCFRELAVNGMIPGVTKASW